MKNTLSTDTFLPPGVQRRVCKALHLTIAPQELPCENCERLAALWRRRNTCPEAEITQIDYQMECTAIDGWVSMQIAVVHAELGRRRVIRQSEAATIIHRVAPSEQRDTIISARLSDDPDGITMWSPDGAGGMRHDQPGTLSHTPLLLLIPVALRVPRHAPHWHRALILRVGGEAS
jgi:hypothetical protein